MPRNCAPFFLSALFALIFSLPAIADETTPQKTFRYNAGGKRDPFAPLIINNQLAVGRPSGSAQGKPVLYGILWDPAGVSIALVDNLEAKVGDIVRGYRVKAIQKDAVILEAEGQTVVLDIAFETDKSGATTQKEHLPSE